MKGKARVEQDLFDTLQPFFKNRISGTLYMSDTRPRDSRKEDAVIIAGTPQATQIQTGRVRVLIFIADIDCGIGRPAPDLERIQEVEDWAEDILSLLNKTLLDYDFEFFTAPAHGTTETEEHFVDINFQYKLTTF